MGWPVQKCWKYLHCTTNISYLGCVDFHLVSRMTKVWYLGTTFFWTNISFFGCVVIPPASRILKARYLKPKILEFRQIPEKWTLNTSQKKVGGNQCKLKTSAATSRRFYAKAPFFERERRSINASWKKPCASCIIRTITQIGWKSQYSSIDYKTRHIGSNRAK